MAEAEVVLVQMPDTWLSPSLALSLLASELRTEGMTVNVEYANMRYRVFLGENLYNSFQPLEDLLLSRGWEVFFAQFAGFKPSVSVEELFSAALAESALHADGDGCRGKAAEGLQNLLKLWQEMTARTEEFLEAEVDRILALKPKIVGCALLTQQRNASFAIINRLKQRCPELITVLGGGVCTTESAPHLLRVVQSLDYVWVGEGDGDFALACRLLLRGEMAELTEHHPWLVAAGHIPVCRAVKKLEECPVPDLTDYFTSADELGLSEVAMHHPVVVEASRGCWWAQSRRCRFCGLHYEPELTVYRRKNAERFWQEIKQLHNRYGIIYFQLADCIINRELVLSLPDTCPSWRRELRLFAECRTDLTLEEMHRLKINGFIKLQPGIEALQDNILNLMNKGRNTAHQLLFLRRGRELGFDLVWNIIYNIPGATVQDYEEQLALCRRLHHLQPPSSLNAMLLAHSSPFYNQRDKFGVKPCIRMVERASDPADEEFTLHTAEFFFDGESKNHMPYELLVQLQAERAAWRKDYRRGASLQMMERGGALLVFDRRNPEKPAGFMLSGLTRQVAELSMDGIRISQLQEQLAADETSLMAAVELLDGRGILYRKGDYILNLAMFM